MRATYLTPLLLIAGCGHLGPIQPTYVDTATSGTICREIGADMPSRSRSDTERTKGEIGDLYDTFAIVCPDYTHLIP